MTLFAALHNDFVYVQSVFDRSRLLRPVLFGTEKIGTISLQHASPAVLRQIPGIYSTVYCC
jgi:hypothetical protein